MTGGAYERMEKTRWKQKSGTAGSGETNKKRLGKKTDGTHSQLVQGDHAVAGGGLGKPETEGHHSDLVSYNRTSPAGTLKWSIGVRKEGKVTNQETKKGWQNPEEGAPFGQKKTG